LNQFNENLRKCLDEGRQVILNKDNDSIYNVIHYLIEEPNKLVFEQAI